MKLRPHTDTDTHGWMDGKKTAEMRIWQMYVWMVSTSTAFTLISSWLCVCRLPWAAEAAPGHSLKVWWTELEWMTRDNIKWVCECVRCVCLGVVAAKAQLIAYFGIFWVTGRQWKESEGNVLQIHTYTATHTQTLSIWALLEIWPASLEQNIAQMFPSWAPDFRGGECEECSDSSLHNVVKLDMIESRYWV